MCLHVLYHTSDHTSISILFYYLCDDNVSSDDTVLVRYLSEPMFPVFQTTNIVKCAGYSSLKIMVFDTIKGLSKV